MPSSVSFILVLVRDEECLQLVGTDAFADQLRIAYLQPQAQHLTLTYGGGHLEQLG